LTGVNPVRAQTPASDTLLINGKFVVHDGEPTQALALRDGKIVAMGDTSFITALARPATRVIDVGGRTVIPGLIDSHIHAIRAGLSYTTEVQWLGVRTLKDALERLRAAAQTAPRGSWLIVAGGWTERQFQEDVYIQWFYSSVLLGPGSAAALNLAATPALADRLTLERSTDGTPTGWLTGDNRAISDLFNLLPRPTYEQKLISTRSFFRALNAVGVTGINDPGGYNLEIEDYQPVLQLWREQGLTLRVRYSLSAPRRDHELEDFKALTQALPMGSGDDWLRFNGIGENVTWGFYNNENPSDAHKAQLTDVLRWAVARGMTATFHWHNDRSVHHLLEVLERVNAQTPVAQLRWSIAHLNDASAPTLQRLQALGMGWLVQNAFYYRGEAFLGQRGAEAARTVPPLVSAARMSLPMGAGTDAHRVMSPNPFIALQWMLDGKTVAGIPMRAPEELPTRIEALRLYTQGSAWFSFEDKLRGGLAVGQLADLAVLDRDYLSVPIAEVGETVSLLTMVGGRIVYAAGPFAALEEKSQ
jgi:predicted amidohydrolase YtcJ